jgi:phosphoribosylformylglycinamidine synthase
MATRIAVTATVHDARGDGYAATMRAAHPDISFEVVGVADLYTIDAPFSQPQVAKAARALANPTVETYEINTVPVPAAFSYLIEVGFHPGVTDNVGMTARETIADATERAFADGEGVFSSRCIFIRSSCTQHEAERLAAVLYNPLIERARVLSNATVAASGLPITVPRVHLEGSTAVDMVDLDIPDADLAVIGKKGVADMDGTRRGPLALSLPYMKAIQKHFRKLKRKPTDIEIESLAQTWSEHCKHTIFADPLDEVKEGIYRRYIKGATQKIRAKKGVKDFCVSVFKDNSGAIVFDDEFLVTHKVETHNSPSALDPFGGAITGIVGVNRDALGFGMGAKPIANTYGFCVGEPDDARIFYRDEARTQPLLSAGRILDGVVRGINAGGNQSGIPTPLGFVATDPRYRGKPLVFAGTVGIIPKKVRGKKMYEKKARAGDLIVVAGGRVGLDGIHGATFSSEALASGSPATAVQIGDPITQKKLSDAIVREARDAGLYSSVTDNGAGGISCSVAEMAKECGGCIVDLDTVPVKYPGLSPWQIWISESQERMTFAVPRAKWAALKKLFVRHGVEATVIGMFVAQKRCVVRWHRKVIMDLDMRFLHDGRPVEHQRGKKVTRNPKPLAAAQRSGPLSAALLEVLARPSVGSTTFIASQYDHEVQGTSVTKPLQGRGRVNAEAGVVRPVANSTKGVVLSDGYCPWYSDIDTYAMAAASIDTAVRAAVCAGAPVDGIAILDNFCWSSSGTPERLWELKRAAKACYDVAVAYQTPYISGKDSMFNDFRGYEETGNPVHIAVPPTLLVSTIAVMPDAAQAQTLDFKSAGDVVYVLGETNDELGGSEYAHARSNGSAIGGRVPVTDTKANMKRYRALARAITKGLVASATNVSRGGLGVALAKAAIAGQLGVEADLTRIPGDTKLPDSILFSESQGRVVVSVRPDACTAFEGMMRGTACTRIGTVTKASRFMLILPKKTLVNAPLSDCTAAYRTPFHNR